MEYVWIYMYRIYMISFDQAPFIELTANKINPFMPPATPSNFDTKLPIKENKDIYRGNVPQNSTRNSTPKKCTLSYFIPKLFSKVWHCI